MGGARGGGPGFAGNRGGADRGQQPPAGRGLPGGAVTETEERKGEATVALSLPLKNLKEGTYTLQIHVWDAIADVNLFQRVPLVVK